MWERGLPAKNDDAVDLINRIGLFPAKAGPTGECDQLWERGLSAITVGQARKCSGCTGLFSAKAGPTGSL
jgi:hypothetical protein